MIQNYEQSFILDGYNLSGITSVSADFSINEEVIKHNAANSFESIVNAPIQGTVNLTRNLLYNDPIISFTGESGTSGTLNYNNLNFGFTQAYLNSYQIQGDASQLPVVTASFDVVGDLGKQIDVSGSKTHPEIYTPTRGSIVVSLDEIINQPLESFSISYKIQRSFQYILGSTEPEVSFLPPIVQEISFSIEIDDYEMRKMKDYLSGRTKNNIQIDFKHFDKSVTFMSFDIQNAKLLSTSFSSSSNDKVVANLSYTKYTA